MVRRALFIIPYFGNLPNTFEIFLRTCQWNPDFEWLIVTDDKTAYDYPDNVHVEYISFEQFAERVQSCFDFPIALKRPYKICDFRAAFGVIFEEELRNYEFWGHCDLDQYFGNITRFITDEILATYDKILCLGHFTLFRNVPEINDMYLTPDRKWNQSYRDAFSEERHWIFDEWPSNNTSINRIMKQESVKTYYCNDCFCDLIPFASRYRRYIFDENAEDWTKEPVKNTVFLWENGRLWCCLKEDGAVKKQEVLYVHIRQRKLSLDQYDPACPAFYIVPNAFVSTENGSEKLTKALLCKANMRGCLFPDELSRKKVIAMGYVKAGMRKLKRLGKEKSHA